MRDKLRGYIQNTRGLRGKIKEGFKNNFILANHDFISLTETWLNDTHSSSELFDDTYNTFRADRNVHNYNILRANRPDLPPETNVMGGGCLIALKNEYSALRMTKWEDEIPFDNVWLKLNTSGNSKIYLHTIYLPGWASFEHYNMYFEQLHDIINIRDPYARFVLLGDFNIPSIKWFPSGNHCIPLSCEGRIAVEFINTITNTNLKQSNTAVSHNNNTLDLVLSNIPISVKCTDALVRVDQHHPPLIVEFSRSDIKFLAAKKTAKFNYFKANYNEINNDLTLIDWNNELNDSDIDVVVDKFYYTIQQNNCQTYTSNPPEVR